MHSKMRVFWLGLFLVYNVIALSRRSFKIEPTGCSCCHHDEIPTINQVTQDISGDDIRKEKGFIGADQSTIVAPKVETVLEHPHTATGEKQTESAHGCCSGHDHGSIGADQSTIMASKAETAVKNSHSTTQDVKQTESAHSCCSGHDHGPIGADQSAAMVFKAEKAIKNSPPTTQDVAKPKRVQSCCAHGHGHGPRGPRPYTCEKWLAEKFSALWKSIANGWARMWEILRRKKKDD